MSSRAEVQKKKNFIEQLLSKDRFMSPPEVSEKVTKEFGSGVANTLIAEVRMDKFGVRLGPGGFAYNKKGDRIEREGRARVAKSEPQIETKESKDRLSGLINELRNEMAKENVQELVIPREGTVNATYLERRTLKA